MRSILDGIPGVSRSRNRDMVIDMYDRMLLLDMDPTKGQSHVTDNSWVRVRRGLYKGDLGLVNHVDGTTLLCDVNLVPRIPLGRQKERGRPSKRLFDEVAVGEKYGEQSIEKRNRLRLFKNNTYDRRFLRRLFHVTDLLTEGINAQEEELDFFRQEPDLWDRAKTFISPITFGDRVRVISGPFIGMIGNITDVMSKMANIVQVGPRQDVQEVLLSEIRKEFTLGDFVQVVRGSRRGVSGFVVHVSESTVIIYTRIVVIRDGFPCELPGNEVTTLSYLPC